MAILLEHPLGRNDSEVLASANRWIARETSIDVKLWDKLKGKGKKAGGKFKKWRSGKKDKKAEDKTKYETAKTRVDDLQDQLVKAERELRATERKKTSKFNILSRKNRKDGKIEIQLRIN